MQEPDEPVDQTELLPVLEGLQKNLSQLTYEVRHGRLQRRLLRILVASIILDLVLSVSLGIVGVKARDAARKATEASSATVVNCLAANQARAANTQLWTFLINLPPATTRTAQQQAEFDQLKSFIATTFAPRDCSPSALLTESTTTTTTPRRGS